MTGRNLRARVLLEEARALGLDLSDLIAAGSTGAGDLPTVASYLATVEPTFTAATARTYRPYWRLAVVHLGDRRLTDVALADLIAVVDDAGVRARRRRPASSGRASRETCVAALRALFGRARDAGLIAANPAASLS